MKIGRIVKKEVIFNGETDMPAYGFVKKKDYMEELDRVLKSLARTAQKPLADAILELIKKRTTNV